MIYHANTKHKKAVVTPLDNFKGIDITNDKQGHSKYKGVNQKVIITLNKYTQNNRASQYMK